jgi:FkbM family methyltransferase
MQKLSNFMPPPVLDWYRRLRYPKYRLRADEIARLESLPRYERSFADLTGNRLEVVDAASFLFMYREIFEQQIYCFRSTTETPFIIDGGANIGLSVIYFKQIYPQSQIVAFEPDPDVFAVLQKNLQTCGYEDVELYPKALWSSETTLAFMHEGADGGRLSRSSDPRTNLVGTTRLRDYLDRQVDFLKLDIEGAETDVLIDCADRLSNIKNLFVEYHSFADKTQTLHSLIGVLNDAGFRLHIHPPVVSPQPFVYRIVNLGMDMQLNIFAFRE